MKNEMWQELILDVVLTDENRKKAKQVTGWLWAYPNGRGGFGYTPDRPITVPSFKVGAIKLPGENTGYELVDRKGRCIVAQAWPERFSKSRDWRREDQA
jgi:hypothetical protein